MTVITTPSAWAKLRTHAYLYGGLSIYSILALGWTGILPVGLADDALAALILVVLATGLPHIIALLKGDGYRQQQEQQAWSAATAPLASGFQRVRQYWASDCSLPLSEVGATGVDLARARNLTAGRQSGGPKTGTGGHKKPVSSGSDDDAGGEPPPANLPLIWTIHDLADTLAVSAKTLQNQPPHLLPPAIRIPGCRGPRYRLRDVLAWLDGFSTGQRSARPLPTRARGRPRIASIAQIAAVRGKGV